MFLSDLRQSSPSPYAVAAASAMNLQSSLVMTQKGPTPMPEQCEALNLGKKSAANNNNAGENEDEPSAKRLKTAERSPPRVQQVATNSRPVTPIRESCHTPEQIVADGDDEDGGGSDGGRDGGSDDKNDGNNNSNMIEMDIDVSAGKLYYLYATKCYLLLDKINVFKMM